MPIIYYQRKKSNLNTLKQGLTKEKTLKASQCSRFLLLLLRQYQRPLERTKITWVPKSPSVKSNQIGVSNDDSSSAPHSLLTIDFGTKKPNIDGKDYKVFEAVVSLLPTNSSLLAFEKKSHRVEHFNISM